MPVPTKDKSKTIPLHHLAGLVPWHLWQGPASHIVWNCKWSATKGLLPVRPVVLSKCEIKLPPGKAVEITGSLVAGTAADQTKPESSDVKDP